MSKPNPNITPVTLTLTPSQTLLAILGIRKTKRALFVWGPPGVAKSAIAELAATQCGIAFIDVRLSQFDPTDLRGMPFPKDIGGVEGITWMPPFILPRHLDFEEVVDMEATSKKIRFYNPLGDNDIYYCTDPKIDVVSVTPGLTANIIEQEEDNFRAILLDENGNPAAGKLKWTVTGKVAGIIALDEFNSATQAVRAASYQLVLNRRLGEYRVPDSVAVVALGNRETDKGIVFRMETPLLNRFVHVEMEPSSENWIDWAMENEVHHSVIGYISAMPNRLFAFDPTTVSRGFATPRSWEMVSDLVTACGDDLPEDILTTMIIGTVGTVAGSEFCSFRQLALELPSSDDVLSGNIKSFPDAQAPLVLHYMLTTSLCWRLREELNAIPNAKTNLREVSETPEFNHWAERANNAIGFILTFKPDIAVMATKMMLGAYKLPILANKTSNFKKFTARYRTLLLDPTDHQ